MDVWKESRQLVKLVYDVTKAFPNEEVYGLTNQLRRCSCSIPSNIAEGCGRKTPNDTTRFLHIARGSLYELETQLFLSLDQEYLNQKELDSIMNQLILCKKLLNGFINYYNSI